jgi:hypothetical protein
MMSPVLTIPDDPAALPGWLDRQLLGSDLDRLAAELTEINRPPSTVPVLDDVLGTDAPRVLSDGLDALPRSSLSLLLRYPTLLGELRDRVLIDGGPYWDAILADDDDLAASERVASRAQQTLGIGPPTTRARLGPPRWVGTVATMFATAAAVLLAVYLGGWLQLRGPQPLQVAGVGWGFAKVRDLPRDAGDAATLTALADLAKQWSKKRPETALDLAHRLAEFREGCAAIQLVDLPLSGPQQEWVRSRCVEWAAEIDTHMRTLEKDRDVIAVRAAADLTAQRIETELRDRAAKAQGA